MPSCAPPVPPCRASRPFGVRAWQAWSDPSYLTRYHTARAAAAATASSASRRALVRVALLHAERSATAVNLDAVSRQSSSSLQRGSCGIAAEMSGIVLAGVMADAAMVDAAIEAD
eukprot:5818434-Prymnesium_polylepis.1